MVRSGNEERVQRTPKVFLTLPNISFMSQQTSLNSRFVHAAESKYANSRLSVKCSSRWSK